MYKILMVENDKSVINSIERLFKAVKVEAEVVMSHPNAIQSFGSNSPMVVIIDVEMPAISANRLVAEFEDIAAKKKRRMPPIIFLYRKDAVLRHVDRVPGSYLEKIPVSLLSIYNILLKLGLIDIQTDIAGRVDEKIEYYSNFIKSSQHWLGRFKMEVLKT